MLVSLHVLAALFQISRVLPDRISASPGSAAALFPRPHGWTKELATWSCLSG